VCVRADAKGIARAYEGSVRVDLVLLLVTFSAGCTINFVKNPSGPAMLQERIEYFKWLQTKGVFASDPEMMKKAAAKLLEVPAREDETTLPAELERILHRLEDELGRLEKEKR
jgi:hypothetical protein